MCPGRKFVSRVRARPAGRAFPPASNGGWCGANRAQREAMMGHGVGGCYHQRLHYFLPHTRSKLYCTKSVRSQRCAHAVADSMLGSNHRCLVANPVGTSRRCALLPGVHCFVSRRRRGSSGIARFAFDVYGPEAPAAQALDHLSPAHTSRMNETGWDACTGGWLGW